MVLTGTATTIPASLRKKLVGVALASSEFNAALVDAAAEIRACAKPRSSEATIEGCFERVLYALLREIGVKIHPEKEVAVDLRRHLAKGRLDSRIGAVVIEYKRPSLLQTPSEVERALVQLEEYLITLSFDNTTQFVGILTNGLRVFEVRALRGVIMNRTAGVRLDASSLGRIARLLTNLDLTALTAKNLIRDFCGSEADGLLFHTARALYGILLENPLPKTQMLQSEWQEMFRLSHDDLSQQRRIEERRVALGEIFGLSAMDTDSEYRSLFALQTAYSIVLKLIAFRVVSDVFLGRMSTEFRSLAAATNVGLRMFCARLEDGEEFRELGILNLLEGDFFSWYSDQQQWTDEIARYIKRTLEILARYEDAPSIFASERAHDLFRELYQAAMPRSVRSSLGEFYTPYWLAEHVLSSAVTTSGWRAIDPCCGSGTFVVAAITRLREEQAQSTGATSTRQLSEILHRVAAIDLNPISVLMTRINYFIHISDLLQHSGVQSLVIPVYLGDAAGAPEHVEVDGVDCLRYQLRTLRAPIDTSLPVSLMSETAVFMRTMTDYERHIKADDEEKAVAVLIEAIPARERTTGTRTEIVRVTQQLLDLERNGWDGIWARILSNFMTTACLGRFTAIVGNPPWIDWKNLPAGYRERIKARCVDRGLFSGAGRTGGINLNICALICYTVMTNWLDERGRLAFLMPRELINQPSYEGWRRLGSKGWAFVGFNDWSKAGHPFDPVKEDFLTFVIAKETAKSSRGVPLLALTKADKTRPTEWKSSADALQHLDVKERIAGQIIPQSTAFTVADNERRLKQFSQIAGKCEYVGREGIEFYPQELLLFKFDSLGPEKGTVFVRNIQVTKSKYKHPPRRILLESTYLYPLVKGPAIEPFHHNYEGLVVAFPYEEDSPLRPLPKNELRFKSPRLFRYYHEARESLESQTKFSDKIRGADPGEFYGLARTGPYSFAETYVAFRDNTRWCASVVTSAKTAWGERKRFVFQNHAVSMCESQSAGEFITLDEAHFICAILNTPIVEQFIRASSDDRSFKIRPPVYVPHYDSDDPIHRLLVESSKLAHKQPNDTDQLRRRAEEWYLELCSRRA